MANSDTESTDFFNREVNAIELADTLGISVARIDQLRRDGHLQYAEGKKGVYTYGEAIRDYCDRLQHVIDKRSGEAFLSEDNDLNPVQESARLKKVTRELLEIEIEHKSGGLLPLADMLEVWERIIANAEVQLEVLSGRIIEKVPYLNKREKEDIKRSIRDIYEQLVEDGEAAPEQAIQISLENIPASAKV